MKLDYFLQLGLDFFRLLKEEDETSPDSISDSLDCKEETKSPHG